uniref:Secreted protein n=1 Tax=Heterorhabditis bacteriophora TaxID=37862 RepID=A0A1I7XDT7_HETBA
MKTQLAVALCLIALVFAEPLVAVLNLWSPLPVNANQSHVKVFSNPVSAFSLSRIHRVVVLPKLSRASVTQFVSLLVLIHASNNSNLLVSVSRAAAALANLLVNSSNFPLMGFLIIVIKILKYIKIPYDDGIVAMKINIF